MQDTGRHYDDLTVVRVEAERGDLVVPATQPKGTLVKVLFEPTTHLADSLTYDITAWALPYVYGLDAYALTDAGRSMVEAQFAWMREHVEG